MNKSTYGENLLERYLTSRGIAFERELPLPGTSKLIDFVVDHPTHGKILLEVKDIENPMPVRGFSAFDPYLPIREHIEEGTRKFKSTKDYLCVLVLAAPPGSFVQLNDPTTMLGAMYGNLGFTVPIWVGDGPAPPHDDSQIKSKFLIGDGKMVRQSRLQNTRISALVSIIEFELWQPAMRKYLNTDDGRTKAERVRDIYDGLAGLPEEGAKEIGVTVWENGTSDKKIPHNLFGGPMDAWWEARDGAQGLRFVGAQREALGLRDDG